MYDRLSDENHLFRKHAVNASSCYETDYPWDTGDSDFTPEKETHLGFLFSPTFSFSQKYLD